LDPEAGPAWRQIQRNGRLTLYPSIWRDSGCRSHFILWKGEILLFDTYSSDEEEIGRFENTETASAFDRKLILEALNESVLERFDSIANRVGADPWEVLSICRGLVRSNQAVEGAEDQHGYFRKRVT
jgi:hypothetical protein